MGLFSDITDTLFGGSKQKSRQSSNSQLDPRLMDAFLGNLERAKGVANDWKERTFADFAPDYEAGADVIRGTTGEYARGADATGRAADMVSGGPSRVDAGTFLTGDINPYMSKATDLVVDRALGDIDRSRQITMQGVGDDAIAAGAFGGSRHGVAEAETNRNYAEIAANTAAGLRADAFRDATSLQARDQDRTLGADQFNVGATRDYSQLLGSLGEAQKRTGLQGAEALRALGLEQQELEQMRLDAERNQDAESLRIINEALGIAPAGGAGTASESSGTSKGRNQTGVFNALGNFFGGMI